MLDDIDYSDLTPAQPKAAPTSEPKKKSTIADRSVVKPSEKSVRKPVDVEGLTNKAEQIQADVGAPEIPDPLAQYGLPALGALGALGTAYGFYKSLQNKNPPPPPPPPPPPSGPDYSAYNSPAYLRNAPVPPDAPVVAAPTVAPVPPTLPQQTNLTPEDLAARAAQTRAAITPEMPVATPISAAPPGAPAPEPSANPNSSTTSIVNNTVKEMIDEVDNSPPEMRTVATSQAAPETANKPVPPVYPKAGTKFKTEADIPPGFVARYDVGNIDRSMGNVLGLENRAYARDLLNEGKPFGQAGPGKNQLNTDVSNLTKQYFQQLQGQIPETLLGRDARQAQKIPSEFGVFGKNTNFGRGVTVGGRAATIFALADVANAAQQGNYGGAALQAADIATDYLPFVGQVKQALSPSSAGEGSTLSPQIVAQQKAYMDNLYRLGGGPLANTEAGERFRRNEEMTRRIAGRTGAAVPPQYRR